MMRGPISSATFVGLFIVSGMLTQPSFAQTPEPNELLQEAERLAWLKVWTRAAPLYDKADRLFTARGDRRNALYARINSLRGRLPTLAVPDVSERLADYLEDPLVQSDDRLRLRCLVIKGETDVDLDPILAERSWLEASELAQKLGEARWANRAQGELGLIAFLKGDIGTAVIKLGSALKVAESNGDVASVVRWLTLFGHGYRELGRAEQSLEYYDRAFKAAGTVRQLQFPVMTYLGKGDALVTLGRIDEAEALLDDALIVARREGALGFEAELVLKQASIEDKRRQTQLALESLARAADLARQAGANRILAEVALERARILRASDLSVEADRTLRDGIEAARAVGERLLLPRLLAQLADLKSSQRRFAEASDLLEEASDLFEGLLTKAGSPWVRSRVIDGMNEIFVARVRLEGARGRSPEQMYEVLEQGRGRSLLELLLSTPVSDVSKSSELRSAERQIAALQLKLLRANGRSERQRLLDQIFAAEEALAPLTTELFNQTRTDPRKPSALRDLQRALRADEVLLEYVLAEPSSYCVVITSTSSRLHRLSGQTSIQKALEPLVKAVREGSELREASAIAHPVRACDGLLQRNSRDSRCDG